MGGRSCIACCSLFCLPGAPSAQALRDDILPRHLLVPDRLLHQHPIHQSPTALFSFLSVSFFIAPNTTKSLSCLGGRWCEGGVRERRMGVERMLSLSKYVRCVWSACVVCLRNFPSNLHGTLERVCVDKIQ